MFVVAATIGPGCFDYIERTAWASLTLSTCSIWGQKTVRSGHADQDHSHPAVVEEVAVPIWIKQGINAWMTAARIEEGRLLRPLSKSGKILRDELGDWAIWSVVEQSSKQIGIEHFGAHDLRRTCAKLCRKNGGDIEQIKFLLGHSSIQTTERYLGSEQEIVVAVNDNLGL